MWCRQFRVASIMQPSPTPPPPPPLPWCRVLSVHGRPPEVQSSSTPRGAGGAEGAYPYLVATEWRAQLRDHPDQAFVGYILSGLQGGFRVGFNHTSPLAPAKKNMPSAAEHPEVLEEYIQGEVQQGRMIGPLAGELRDGCHMNRMGVIPKGHTRASGVSLQTSPSRNTGA